MRIVRAFVLVVIFVGVSAQVNEKYAKKVFKWAKHAWKNKLRTGQGKLPTHTGAPPLGPDEEKYRVCLGYARQRDPKYDVEAICAVYKRVTINPGGGPADSAILLKASQDKYEKKVYKWAKHALNSGSTQPDAARYNICVAYGEKLTQEKIVKQAKHVMKDKERVARGLPPLHSYEDAHPKDYAHDPKFNPAAICAVYKPNAANAHSALLLVSPSDGLASTIALGALGGSVASALCLLVIRCRQSRSVGQERLLSESEQA